MFFHWESERDIFEQKYLIHYIQYKTEKVESFSKINIAIFKGLIIWIPCFRTSVQNMLYKVSQKNIEAIKFEFFRNTFFCFCLFSGWKIYWNNRCIQFECRECLKILARFAPIPLGRGSIDPLLRPRQPSTLSQREDLSWRGKISAEIWKTTTWRQI